MSNSTDTGAAPSPAASNEPSHVTTQAQPVSICIQPGTPQHWRICSSSYLGIAPEIRSLTLDQVYALLDAAKSDGIESDEMYSAAYACSVLAQLGTAAQLAAISAQAKRTGMQTETRS